MFAGKIQRNKIRKQTTNNKIILKIIKPSEYKAFGDILTIGVGAPKLEPNNTYTITLEFSGLFMPSENKITELVRKYLVKATIEKVSRGLFSGRFVITLKPTQTLGLNTTINNLIIGIKQEGYEVKLIQIESGIKSTAPGGAKQVVIKTVSEISETASDIGIAAFKPLVPWIIGAGALLIGYTWWKVGGLDSALRPKQPNGVGKGNYKSEVT